ncbi:endothelial lipase-like [Anoplophora glabripennis]|uniref:endothelial lipase-like n=1 Tax=Anoplophora glabripennis TaxID=217634 RepID=UPI00087518FE|nr:endothelial lipase-like [Anoplophora glabripennis]
MEVSPFVIVFAIFSIVSSGPVLQGRATQENSGANLEYFLVETSPGVYEVEDLVNSEITVLAAEADIVYYYFNQNDTLVGTEILSTNIAALGDTEFSTDLETVFLIHGWNGNKTAESNTELTEAILAVHNVNIIVVDWSAFAINNYISAKSSVDEVGEYVANFIQSLVDTSDLDLSTVTLIGFSLGAHVAGNAGAGLDGQVAVIIGLDPAGPLFSVFNTDERLDSDDAQFVQVIHTSTLLGYDLPLGNADYFPNGGTAQPGCGIDVVCSHERAYIYYAESVLASTNNFVALQCSTYARYIFGTCIGNDESVMGGYPVNKTANGSYYLNTNNASPFA